MRLRTRVAVIVLIVLALGLMLAAGPIQAQEEGDPENGAQLYADNCFVCHGSKGAGRQGASLQNIYGGINPDEYFADAISTGVQGTFMPAWGSEYGGPLTEAEITDIVAYIESWGTAVEPVEPAPPRPSVTIPPVPDVDGDPNVGYTVFQSNCATCHGDKGQGQIGASLNTAFPALSPEAFAVNTIRNGVSGSLMPPFAQSEGGPLNDEDINNVAAYVLSIQKAGTPQPVETTGSASAWPFMLVLAVLLAVVIVIGVVSQRDKKPGEGGEA